MSSTDFTQLTTQLTGVVEQTIYGMTGVIRLATIGLFTNGHILLEGNPGLGKTALVRAIGDALNLPFRRIQFTPDILPSDITGTESPLFNEGTQNLRLEFRPGPIFTCLLLADEINRATPKTQAAMLEAMAERQVTVTGKTYRLDNYNFDSGQILNDSGQTSNQVAPKRPFMVLATQNPIDNEGTYELPEAQSDRFMFKVIVPVPNKKILRQILDKETEKKKPSPNQELARGMLPRNLDAAIGSYTRYNEEVKGQPVGRSAEAHIANLFLATNRHFDELASTVRPAQIEQAKALVKYLFYGLGPRAPRDLTLAAKAWSLSSAGTNEGVQVDATSVAQVLLPVLRHRIKLEYGWDQASDFSKLDAGAVEPIRRPDYYIQRLAEACLPANDGDYGAIFKGTLAQVIKDRQY